MSDDTAVSAHAQAPPRMAAWLPWFGLPLLVALISDLWSKQVVFARYHDGQSFSWWGELTYNPGVAWGLGKRWPGAVVGLTLLLIPVLTWVWWHSFRSAGRWANVAFGLILGGALGNAWDRCMTWVVGPAGGYKGVRDFIRIDLNMVGITYVWPNFNLADAAISTGFIIVLGLSFLPAKPVLTR